MSSIRIRKAWTATLLCCGVLVGVAPALADDPLIYATIQPQRIILGETADLIITDLGAGASPITMPVVSGLHFEIIGRSHQVEIVKGVTMPSSSLIVRVTPQVAGIFSIPGVTPNSQPVILEVSTSRKTASLTPSTVPKAPPPPPILSGAAIPKGIHLTDDGSAYVRLTVPKREVYVGESVPVEIELGMRSGFVTSLNGLPRLTGDNFTLNDLSRQPQRSETLIAGQPFVLLTWRSMLAVVKPGVFPLVAQTPITIKLRTRPRRDSALDDQFGDPFLQNLFGVSIPKDINVDSPAQELKVSELPAVGRPPDFRGAIGAFSVESDIAPLRADVGEPLTLRMRVIGSGSFDRVDSAMLDHLDSWKTYPPKSSFKSTDSTGQKGEKIFEQPLIASRAGTQTIPPLAFSYFDPNTRRYETARSAPLTVTISPALADSTQTAAEVAAGATTLVSKYAQGLRADHATAAMPQTSLMPLYLQPRFLAIPALLALASVGAWATVRRRSDPKQAAAVRDRKLSKANRSVLGQMEAAARTGNAALFFTLARGALQQTLAQRWQLAPANVTTAEVQTRVGEVGDEVCRLFALADESNYSGGKLAVNDFARWLEATRRSLVAP